MAIKNPINVDMGLADFRDLKTNNYVVVNNQRVIADSQSETGYSCYRPTNTSKTKVELFNLPLPTSSSVVNLTNEEVNNILIDYVKVESGVWSLSSDSTIEEEYKLISQHSYIDKKITGYVYRTNGARFTKDCLPYGKKGELVTREYCNYKGVGRKFKIVLNVTSKIATYIYLGTSGNSKAIRLDLFNLLKVGGVSIDQGESCEIENLVEDENIDINTYTKVPCKPTLNKEALKELGLL